jgi:hypothetical protein
MAADMFMKIDTVEGEAKDAKHKKRETGYKPSTRHFYPRRIRK